MLIQARLQSEPMLRGKRVDTSKIPNEPLSLEKGNTVMLSGRLPSPRSRPTESTTALKTAYDNARLMMSFKAECRARRPAWRRHERGCRPYLSTMAPQRHLCGAHTGRPCVVRMQFEMNHYPAKCLLQWAEDSSSLRQKWVVLPKRDMPVGAGQEGDSVKNLGFTLDCHLTMNSHVSNTARTCYFELHRLASIRRFLTSAATATLVSAFGLSRIDYCKSLLFGSTHDVTSHYRRTQINASRVFLRLPKSSNVATHLRSLNWLNNNNGYF